MLKTYLYLPDELNDKITQIAKEKKQSKAKVIRKAIEKGLKGQVTYSDAGIEAFLKIGEMGAKYKIKGPKDSSTKIDEYLWDKDWSKDA